MKKWILILLISTSAAALAVTVPTDDVVRGRYLRLTFPPIGGYYSMDLEPVHASPLHVLFIGTASRNPGARNVQAQCTRLERNVTGYIWRCVAEVREDPAIVLQILIADAGGGGVIFEAGADSAYRMQGRWMQF